MQVPPLLTQHDLLRGHQLISSSPVPSAGASRITDRRLREVVRTDRSRLAVAGADSERGRVRRPARRWAATGHVADGVAASAGALIVGFANLGGRYRLRSATLLATTLASRARGSVGRACRAEHRGDGCADGRLGVRRGTVGGVRDARGIRWDVVDVGVLLAGDLNLHGEAVVREACLITAGGLVQTLVAIAAWPIRPFAAERRAVAHAYRALARCARAPDTVDAPEHRRLAHGGCGSRRDERASRRTGALRALVEDGEWIRLHLAALARSDVPAVNDTRAAAARALEAIAAGDDPGLPRRAGTRRPGDRPGRRAPAGGTPITWIAAAGRESRAGAPGPSPRLHPLHALRAELTLRSSTFRHAARLAVALIAAGIAYRSLSLGSGYWVPLTVLFVLKPDYGTTITRGIGRATGRSPESRSLGQS